MEAGSRVLGGDLAGRRAVVTGAAHGIGEAIARRLIECGARVIAVDLDDNRLELAKRFGATDSVNSGTDGWQQQVMGMTDGLGVDVAVEAVGIPVTFEACTQLVRPGGTVANCGVHGKSVELRLQDLWIKDVAITTGLVSATTLPMLLKLVAQGKLQPQQFATHHFPLDKIMDAYETFGNAAQTKAMKVILSR